MRTNKLLIVTVVASGLIFLLSQVCQAAICPSPGCVETDDLQDRAVTGKKIKNGAVKSFQIKDGSIKAKDIGSGVRAATLVVATDGTGDYTDIQSAINALPAGGGSVYIREGTYTIASSIVVPSNVSLIGAGYATKIVVAEGANISGITNSDTENGNSHIVISNLQLDGSASVSPANGIYFDKASNSRIEECWIHDWAQFGIYLDEGTDNTLSYNHCNSNNGAAITVTESSNNTLIDNQCNSNGSGIGWGGIIVFVGHDNTLSGNHCYSNDPHGITLAENHNNTLSGNHCDSNYGAGIRVFRSENNTLIGNQCNNNIDKEALKGDGIQLDNDCDYNVIVGNRCTGNTNYGIDINNAACNQNLVDGNIYLGNTAAGLFNGGTGTLIGDNIP